MLGTRQLSILAVLAVLAVGVALWLESARTPDAQISGGGALLPTLQAQAQAVDRIVISSAGKPVVSVQKTAKGWVMPERDNYPVDVDALRKLLSMLTEAKRVAAKTSDPQRYARLGLRDPAKVADARGVRLDLHAADQVISLIIGDTRQGGKGSFVRVGDDPQSWMLDRNLTLEKRASYWLQRSITDIIAARVLSASVEHPATADAKADKVEIKAKDKHGSAFELVNLPKGRELADGYSIEALAGFLAALRLDDVRPAKPDATNDNAAAKATFHSRDGIVLRFDFWHEGDQPSRTWARFDVSLDAAQAQLGIAAAQAQAKAEYDAAVITARKAKTPGDDANATEGDAAKAEADIPVPLAISDAEADAAARLAQIKAEIDTIQQRISGREFELPTSKASNLERRLDAYLKPESD